MSRRPEPIPANEALITRALVAQQIAARLAGTLDDAGLAAWAFDRFYGQELGTVTFEPGAEDAVADALDALMFGDEPSFRLDEEELRELIARLDTV